MSIACEGSGSDALIRAAGSQEFVARRAVSADHADSPPVSFKEAVKLVGQHPDCKEVVNYRRAQSSNLGPGDYRFRVTTCNNGGVWNEAGNFLDFSVAAAYYQSRWFQALCVAAFSGIALCAVPASIGSRGNSTCVWKSTSMSARALPASCTTLCCRAFGN